MVSDVRGVLGVSQSIFARFLGVSVNAVRTWEQGTKTPQGGAQRFMDEMRRDPDYWRARLQESVKIRERA
jgi:putative transcriptional regulator